MSEQNRPDVDRFRADVLAGLGSPRKHIPSKYFYDAKGDEIFREIMELEEYYLTRSELEILNERSDEILTSMGQDHFEIVELGAGDGQKTRVFLQRCLRTGKDITYVPVDISENVLSLLEEELSQRLPSLEIQPQSGEYLPALDGVDRVAPRRLIMFMGGTIGNFRKPEAMDFMRDLGQHMHSGDHLLIGFDLKKHPRMILAAYDDAAGVTRRFNLNLLERINRELEGTFELSTFDHYATYDPASGTVASFLISLKDQEVTVGGSSFRLAKHESIHTEVSMKYDRNEITAMGDRAGLNLERLFLDKRELYALALYGME